MLFLFLCGAAAAADMSTVDPSLGLDGLYTVLGLLLGVNAYNERNTLLKVLEQRAAAANALDSSTGSSNSNKP
jgi:hypothetical protein